MLVLVILPVIIGRKYRNSCQRIHPFIWWCLCKVHICIIYIYIYICIYGIYIIIIKWHVAVDIYIYICYHMFRNESVALWLNTRRERLNVLCRWGSCAFHPAGLLCTYIPLSGWSVQAPSRFIVQPSFLFFLLLVERSIAEISTSEAFCRLLAFFLFLICLWYLYKYQVRLSVIAIVGDYIYIYIYIYNNVCHHCGCWSVYI